MGFDESWLADYQRRQATGFVPVLPDRFGFTIHKLTSTLNEWQRMHWANRSKHVKSWSHDIAAVTAHLLTGAKPLERARVTITRHGLKEPDTDGLYGGIKPLVDCLLPRSDRHPHGLGFVVDDSPQHMELIATSERVGKRADQRTVVLIERVA